MAYVKELKTSGEGDEAGLLGATATREFLSVIDTIGDDELDALIDAVPVNTPHPKQRFAAAVSARYVRVEQLGPLEYVVQVRYYTPDILTLGGSFNGWKIGVRFETTTEQVGRTLPTFDKRGRPIDEGVLVGPHIYDPIPTDQATDEDFKAFSPLTGKMVILKRRGGTDKMAPIDVTPLAKRKTHLVLEFSKSSTSMTMAILEELGRYANYVNAKNWKGFPATTLMFTNCTIGEETSATDSGYTDFKWPITLQFTQNAVGWTPLDRVETWSIDNKQAEVTKYRDNSVIVNHYSWYYGMNFDKIFSLAGGSVTGRSIPIQPTVRP